MTKAGRALEILIGLTFVFAAAMKAWNVEGFVVQVAAYRVLTDPAWIEAAAYGTIVLETVLGALFLVRAGTPTVVYTAAGLMTIVYTGLIAYAWPEDCGCLGALIQMGPVESITKNAVLLAVMVAAYVGTRLHVGLAKTTPLSAALAGFGLLAVIALGVYDAATRPEATVVSVAVDADRPFAQFKFTLNDVDYDLGNGEYLLAMLNAECEHCKASVPGLNALAADKSLPPMVALMMGDDETLDAFILETLPEFPTQLIDKFVFLNFIEKAPPQLNLDRDGHLVDSWIWKDNPPTAEQIRTETTP